MRLVIARCSVDYVGRLTAHLPSALRLLIVKADGSVLVHSDGGSYKPLNWMSPPCRLTEQPGLWSVTNKAGETLAITLTEVISDTSVDLGVDPGLVKDGVEAHLQELLAAQVELLGDGWRLVRREYPTPIGPVDLMCRDGEDEWVAVEIKRIATIDAVEQLTRYLERIRGASIYPAVQNIVLACRALGLGTTITTNHLRLEDEVKAVLGVPENVQTVALMPVGYPRDQFGPLVRRPVTDVAYADRWGQPWRE